MRAAVYARFSTDLQNDRSVDDQIDLCRDYARRHGWTVVAAFRDRARSGASMFGRDGLAALIEGATAREFDIVVAEAADRISRDMADLAGLHKQFAFRGIEIDCVNGGRLDTLQIGVHGLVGQMQREEGAKKVRRGMSGVVRDGRNAGGRAYGYRPILGQPGKLEIVPEQADVIRRIFASYADGTAPRAIAAALNADGVPAPRGERWNASTINGSGTRGHGILRNPLYDGRIVWNRVRMVKDPSNGKRVSRPNDAGQHQEALAEELRIIEHDLFEAVQARKAATGGEAARRAPKTPRVLSGLLRCSCCGGGMTLVGTDRSGPRVMCSTRRESSSCENGARYYVERLEHLVVSAIGTQLADPDLLNDYIGEYVSERRETESGARAAKAATERALDVTKEKMTRVTDLLVDGLLEKADATARLASLRAEEARLKRELALAGRVASIIDLQPIAMTRYRDNVDALSRTMADASRIDPALTRSFRDLVAGVIVLPRERRGEYAVKIEGKLSGLVGPDLSAIPLVAEEGLEPPTRGL
ncbi:recombinase family protein [Chenggangzhangella methanolivorans]|uniref:Recombinase family protein n=1 Tax=Chenggangzhangella methanolivorans TaxID=1437009 RepID=A0A9E6RF02_9HYPH|nr:recombinase family protein [Chenggangzhangella methanolivorans]QZO02319.1 recombinase family protein [Chenggangzhangella methanolivorans]